MNIFENSPAFLNLWRKLPAAFLADNRIITPLYFQGAAAATEYLAYDAKKLYVALSVTFTISAFPTAGFGNVQVQNETDANSYFIAKIAPYWDASVPALRSCLLPTYDENIYFSRVILSGYTHIRFNGYKITIP